MSSMFHAARCVHKTKEEIEICLAYNKSRPLTSSWRDARNISFAFSSKSQKDPTTTLSLRPSVSYSMWYSGLFSWSVELLASASRQLAKKLGPLIMNLSARFIHISLYSSLWASVACVRSRPGSEAPCITHIVSIFDAIFHTKLLRRGERTPA